MKKLFAMMVGVLTMFSVTACGGNDDELLPDESQQKSENNETTESTSFDGKKVLVAYFSWGGTTERLANEIQSETGGDIFKIEPVTPYPTAYTPTTEVALEEKNSDARPAIKDKVENWADYDIVFVGCPVWWWTAPMIINTFAESYDFKGKTVVPFVTYSSTYRDETIQKIVDLTKDADRHLPGYSNRDRETVKEWIERISK